MCTNKKKVDQRKSKINHLQSELHHKTNISESERHNLHCQIQNERILRQQDLTLAKHSIPIAYANKQAKLQLIENWPSDLKTIKQKIRIGAYKNRKWGDVEDIGFRKIAPNRKKDVPLGRKEVKRMRESGMMPPEVKDPEVVDCVKRVAHKKDSMREFMYPPKKQHYVEDTTSFKKMKRELAEVKANAKEEGKKAPSLKQAKMEKGCRRRTNTNTNLINRSRRYAIYQQEKIQQNNRRKTSNPFSRAGHCGTGSNGIVLMGGENKRGQVGAQTGCALPHRGKR